MFNTSSFNKKISRLPIVIIKHLLETNRCFKKEEIDFYQQFVNKVEENNYQKFDKKTTSPC